MFPAFKGRLVPVLQAWALSHSCYPATPSGVGREGSAWEWLPVPCKTTSPATLMKVGSSQIPSLLTWPACCDTPSKDWALQCPCASCLALPWNGFLCFHGLYQNRMLRQPHPRPLGKLVACRLTHTQAWWEGTRPGFPPSPPNSYTTPCCPFASA